MPESPHQQLTPEDESESGWDRLPIEVLQQFDSFCDEFEQLTLAATTTVNESESVERNNPSLSIEEQLAAAPENIRDLLLPELLAIELEVGTSRGGSPDIAEYRRRFPDHIESVNAVFERTAKYSPQPARSLEQVIEKIERYRIDTLLGQGGFARVFKGFDTTLERAVAIKIPHGELMADAISQSMYLTEAKNVAGLDHPHIVPVYDVGSNDEFPCYIVSRHIDGISLATLLRRERPCFRDTVLLVASIADALHYAHENGLVHRDVKPSNILIDTAGAPHLADFGLALRDQQTSQRSGGTPAYMSPEQAAGYRVDRRSDIFSLAVVLYEMLTGQRPFQGDTSEKVLGEVAKTEANPLRQHDPQLPTELEQICLRAMSKRVEERQATARELATDLRRWLSRTEPKSAKRISPRRRLVLGGLAMLCVLATVVASHRVWKTVASNDLHQRADAAVATLGNARSNSVARAINDLDAFPPEIVLEKLRTRMPGSARSEKFVLACALAKYGDVDVGYLINRISDAPAEEVDNLIIALEHAKETVLSSVRSAAEQTESGDLGTRSRLAMVAIHLGDSSLARDMCQLRPDPIQRTCFIGELAKRHGDLSRLADVLTASSDPSLQSAICLAAGSHTTHRTHEDTAAWQKLASEWYQHSPHKEVHSAAGWLLHRWELEVPILAPSSEFTHKRDWYLSPSGLTMLKIPAGKFDNWYNAFDNRMAAPQTVTLTRDYLISDREITVAQYRQAIQDADYPDKERPSTNPWPRKEPVVPTELAFWNGPDAHISPSDQHPVQQVTWIEAVMYCNWLSRKEGLPVCYERTGKVWDIPTGTFEEWALVPDASGYRLPAHAEWEHACRATSATDFSFGDDSRHLPRYCVFGSNRTEVCGSKLPNDWGLFDMHGNVAEWCNDWNLGYRLTAPASVVDPKESPSDPLLFKIACGGNFLCSAGQSTTHQRWGVVHVTYNNQVGFRVARSLR